MYLIVKCYQYFYCRYYKVKGWVTTEGDLLIKIFDPCCCSVHLLKNTLQDCMEYAMFLQQD